MSFVVAYEPGSTDHDTFRAQYDDVLTKMGLTRELAMAGVRPGEWWKGDGQ